MHVIPFGVNIEIDVSASRGEFERVGQEIAKDFADAVGVPHDFARHAGIAGYDEAHVALACQNMERGHQVIEQVTQCEWPRLELAAARLEPADIQQLFHQAADGLALHFQRLAHLELAFRQLAVDALFE